MKKILYEKPTTQTFLVRVGRCLCDSRVFDLDEVDRGDGYEDEIDL